MASSIGIRIYQVSVNKKGHAKFLEFDDPSLSSSPQRFMHEFVGNHSLITQREDLERSWYFEQKKNSAAHIEGYVHYGTFGFESNFIDGKTKKKNYRRKSSDIEEIPLYFSIWFPSGKNFGLIAFQSFQGRSCIAIVMTRMKELYEAKNPEILLKFKKLMPVDLASSSYYSAPVKKLSFIRRNVSSDIADRYGATSEDPIDLELSLVAKRRRSLGDLIEVKTGFSSKASGLMRVEGMDFEEAIAEVSVGGQRRKVGIVGYNTDAGVIELSDSVKRGPDGHPTFQSISTETGKLLKDFVKTLAE